MTHYFSDIPQFTRPAKPRSSGATFIIDWGIGPVQQQDLLRSAAEFVDLAKIAVGIPGLLPAKILDEKVQIYQQHQVHPFPGGQFLEHAYPFARNVFVEDILINMQPAMQRAYAEGAMSYGMLVGQLS